MSSFLRLERKQKILQMHSELAYFYFFVLIHLELERQIRLYTSVVPSKIIPVFTPKRNKRAKTLTSAAAHTYMAYIGKYPFPPPPSLGQLGYKNNNNGPNLLFQTVFKH